LDIMTSQSNDDIMTEVLTVAEAKRRFSELIDRVLEGERFVVTRRGRPVMSLSAVPDELPVEPETAPPGGLLALAGILEGVMTDEEVDEMVAEIYADRRRSKTRPLPPEWFE
jgi:antitoxin (DNA-binding transcriptional repressor) of toxin-antitoxin stability system